MNEEAANNESAPAVNGRSIFELERLLKDDITLDNPGWLTTLAPRKVFYIRGYNWFKSVIGDVREADKSEQAILISKMASLTSERVEWASQDVVSSKPFSFRVQVADALGQTRSNQRLEKALGTLGVCEAFLLARRDAGKTEITVPQMYGRMSIQPACYYVSNFTAELVERIKQVEPKLLSKLETATKQLRHKVFEDMMLVGSNGSLSRKLVTRELAEGVHKALTELIDNNEKLAAFDPGTVSCTYDPSVGGQNASEAEYIRF